MGDAAARGRRAPLGAPPVPAGGAALRVLVVEDDREDFELTRGVVAAMPSFRSDVRWGATYEQGVDALRQDDYDVALLDYHLGRQTGLEALREAFGGPPPRPVVLVTGAAAGDVDVAAARAGVADLVEKSELRPVALERAIRYALERTRVERELRSARAFFHAAFDAMFGQVAVLDEEGTVLEVNRAWEGTAERNGHLASAAARGESYLAACDAATGEREREGRAAARGIRQVLAGERASFELEYACPSPDRDRWFQMRVTRFADGGRARVLVAHEDVTERRLLEDQLRQSQKMEAIGRLAGGVAHDFNNLLTVIQCNTELALAATEASDPRAEDLGEIRQATARASSLTRQLLTFSRQQVLQPRALDVNAVVGDLVPMLRRLIREDVRMVTTLAPDTGRVLADLGQLEQVLINLAVNARDAMPMGGELTVEARRGRLELPDTPSAGDAATGEYVVLAVTETGVGMDSATRARIFEPFFTTKPLGLGTGLGLATVYGIVKQSGGHIRVSSEPGQGTRFEIYFARLPDAAAPAGVADRGRAATPAGAGTILLVEDEPAVRALTRRILTQYGYRVLEAADGVDALRAAAQHVGVIDLVLTDLVMPNMGGRELVERLRDARPGIRSVFMSGYADEATRLAEQRPPPAYVQKPFTTSALSAAVAEALLA